MFIPFPRNNMKKTLFIICILGYFTEQPIAQDVVITSEKNITEKLPIGITAFQQKSTSKSNSSVNPRDVLLYDLDFSDRFKIFDIVKLDTINKKMLIDSQAMAYITGEIQWNGDGFQLECKLLDTESGDLILGKKYAGVYKDLRLAIHR